MTIRDLVGDPPRPAFCEDGGRVSLERLAIRDRGSIEVARALEQLSLFQRQCRAIRRIGIRGAEGEMLREQLGTTRGPERLLDGVQGDAIGRVQR